MKNSLDTEKPEALCTGRGLFFLEKKHFFILLKNNRRDRCLTLPGEVSVDLKAERNIVAS